ncbi:hypothetical protein [Parapedobacter sp. 2B3]|uniref:hypothetical protein n=1 Tax=Parapedobacter sp. 2B3 TaxID=3342381 RepID=UPI0035B68A6F
MKKTATVPLLIFALLMVFGSCGKKEEDTPTLPRNYVKFAVHGTRFNGNYQMEKKEYAGDVTISAVHFPEGSGDLVALGILDFSQRIGFSLVAPASEKLTEIIQDNPFDFDLGLMFEEGELEAKTVSLNMTSLNVDRESVVVKRLKGNFEGVAVYIFTEDGIKKEEAHTVKGEFEFNAL